MDLLPGLLGWVFFLGVAYLSYRLVWRHARFGLSFRGWGSLEARYGVKRRPSPRSVTSARIGATVFQGTVSIVLEDAGVSFQRVFVRSLGRALLIPYDRFRLVEPYRQRGPVFGLPVYAIFEVDGVEVWLDRPQAEGILARQGETRPHHTPPL